MKKKLYILYLLFAFFQAGAQDLSDIKNQKPFAIHGALDLRAIGYSASGIDPRKKSADLYYFGDSHPFHLRDHHPGIFHFQ
ncbi:MAG: hypothetical protein LRY55_13115 [Leadbetterella sp.]|nr:hypothetical protein [Leadbetterella sp.]